MPRWPGVLCASGLMRADVTHNLVRAFNTSAEDADLEKLSELFGELESALFSTLTAEGLAPDAIELRRYIDARYSGQVYEIETPVSSVDKLTGENLDEIVAAFEDAHDALYHYRMDGAATEFVGCRVEATGHVAPLAPAEMPFACAEASAASKGPRKVYMPSTGRFEDVDTFDGDRLEPGNEIEGVAIVETEGSTLVVWENQRLTVNRYGDFEISLEIKPVFGCDGGLFLRSNENGQAYQVMLDYLEGGAVGGVYGERLEGVQAGQGATADWHKAWKNDDWNHLRARIEGEIPHIQVWLNGTKITDFQDTANHAAGGARDGMIAVQVHGGTPRWKEGGFQRFRNIAVKRLD